MIFYLEKKNTFNKYLFKIRFLQVPSFYRQLGTPGECPPEPIKLFEKKTEFLSIFPSIVNYLAFVYLD